MYIEGGDSIFFASVAVSFSDVGYQCSFQ